MIRSISVRDSFLIGDGRWTDNNASILGDTFWRYTSLIGIIATIVVFTFTSFTLRNLSLSFDTLGPWPDSFDYTYGAVGLLHGTYDIVWSKCPVLVGPTANQCAVEQNTPRKSYYTPGTSILMLPFVAIGGDTWATLLDYSSALVTGITIILIVWSLTCPPIAFLSGLVYFLSPAQSLLSSMALSDLPTALFLFGSACLVSMTDKRALILSGLTSAWLVWLRPQMAIIAPIGLVAVLVLHHSRNKLLLHLVPFSASLIGLALWQWVYYGNPLTTGYQYNAAQRSLVVSYSSYYPDCPGGNQCDSSQDARNFNSPPSGATIDFDYSKFSNGKTEDNLAPVPERGKTPSIFDFFSPYYLTHPAWHADQTVVGGGYLDLTTPTDNIPTILSYQYYILLLLGYDSFLFPIGIGIIGIAGLCYTFTSNSKLLRSFAIFGITSTVFLFLSYSFYYYRSDRFFVPIVPFIIVGMAYIIHKLALHSAHVYKLVLLR